jgi:hypothetical protein
MKPSRKNFIVRRSNGDGNILVSTTLYRVIRRNDGTSEKIETEEWTEKFCHHKQHATLNRPYEVNICPIVVRPISSERA